MGLTIARGLLAAAGGIAWAENAPGAGARFSLTVPGPVRRAAVPQLTHGARGSSSWTTSRTS